MKVYQAIGAVSAAMSHEGIGKGRRNQQQGYNFRGIDDVLNSLSAALVTAGLVILPRCTERIVVERETQKGGAIFNVTCRVEFDLVSTEDGSKHTVCTYGEAMDSADKATNKAMSAAYKYLALLVFCIPTEASAETDADYTTHDVKAAAAPVPQEQVEPQPPKLTPAQVADWLAAIGAAAADELAGVVKRAYAAAERARDREAYAAFRAAKQARAVTA
jgi:hypothetical protein